MRYMAKIEGLERKQPLFRKFCQISSLSDGDLYSPCDYILWSTGLTLEQTLKYIREFNPDFKFPGCNL